MEERDALGRHGELVERRLAEVRLSGPERGVTEQRLRATDTGLAGDVIRERVPHQVRVKVSVDPGAPAGFFDDGTEHLPGRGSLAQRNLDRVLAGIPPPLGGNHVLVGRDGAADLLDEREQIDENGNPALASSLADVGADPDVSGSLEVPAGCGSSRSSARLSTTCSPSQTRAPRKRKPTVYRMTIDETRSFLLAAATDREQRIACPAGRAVPATGSRRSRPATRVPASTSRRS